MVNYISWFSLGARRRTTPCATAFSGCRISSSLSVRLLVWRRPPEWFMQARRSRVSLPDQHLHTLTEASLVIRRTIDQYHGEFWELERLLTLHTLLRLLMLVGTVQRTCTKSPSRTMVRERSKYENIDQESFDQPMPRFTLPELMVALADLTTQLG